jgi:hypothetical protein
MLTTQEIRDRASSYGCCSLSSLYSYVQSKIYGDEKCADRHWRMFLFLRWAQTKMCDPCWSDAQKTELAKRADCFCNPCGCEGADEEVDCTITPDFEVIDAIPSSELPPDPNVGDAYLVTSGDFAGFIATWAESLVYEYTLVPLYNVVETADGDLWTQYGEDGPGLLFPTATLTLVGNALWEITNNSPQTQQNRQVQLLGYGDGVPQQGYVLWQGVESDIPSVLNLFGLPFDTLRLRYILPNGCEYLSDVLTTIPEDPNGCGTIQFEVGEPVVENGLFTVAVTLSNQQGYPLGACLLSLNDGDPVEGQVLVVGENVIGPFALGNTLQITITNIDDSECNIPLEPIVTECPVLVTNFEAITACNEGGDPPVALWGTAGTIEDNPDFPPGSVTYTTPLATDPVACELVDGQWQCGPLEVEVDPGPMTITIESAINKDCEVVLGPFEPSACWPCGNDLPNVINFEVLDENLIPSIQAATTTDYWTIIGPNPEDIQTISVPEQASLPNGRYCAYPSDEEGEPSGTWTGLYVFQGGGGDPGDIAWGEIDLGGLAGSTLTEPLGIEGGSLAIQDVWGVTEISIPALSGSNDRLEFYNCITLVRVNIDPATKFKCIRAGFGTATFDQSSVDALCNALDATATGQVSYMTGTPTIDSLANRNAYIANGNTLAFL